MRLAPRTILLVDDSSADVRLVMEGLRHAGCGSNVLVASDGARALAILRRQGEHVDAPRPDLILLDLNLPRVTGWEVLAEIKVDPDLRLIPVVILSTSAAEEDVRAAYGLHANCYLTKPGNIDDYFSAMASLQQFWLELATLPSNQPVGAWGEP
jgi:two-component system, chemotaxis family, response regulator Rcp1